MSYDVVIRNGFIVDGSGLDAYRADVGVVDGRIATIGRIRSKGAVDIDADGRMVTPGFIDVHTHLDAQVFWDSPGTNSCWHGVTTAVMGNCGFTLAPASVEQRALVVRSLERAEDMSPAALEAGIPWSWTSFPDYLDAVDALPKGINYLSILGHSALRAHVMGERAFVDEASEDELRLMEGHLRDGLAAGAAGFSTSRLSHHRTSDDLPVASRLASWEECLRLIDVMADMGTGVFQFVEDPLPDPAAAEARWQEFVEISATTGVPFAVPAGRTDPTLPRLDAAAEAGARMFGLAHPRGIGSMSSFRTQLPFDRLPGWKEFRALPHDEQLRRLHDPTVVAHLVKAADTASYGEAVGAEARPPDYDVMCVLDSPVPPNRTVAEVAAARGVEPVAAMIQLAVESNLDQFFWQTFVAISYDDTAELLRHPHVLVGFSDSGAHMSQMADASVQTHLLAYWVRKRQAFSFEHAVRMMTLVPARMWGLHDRGMVREGLVADLNVIDPDVVSPSMPRLVHDLPAGEARIEQKSIGIGATLVAGQVTVSDGDHTGSFPGALLRVRTPER